jgi:hypothetical protein
LRAPFFAAFADRFGAAFFADVRATFFFDPARFLAAPFDAARAGALFFFLTGAAAFRFAAVGLLGAGAAAFGAATA